MLKILLGAKDGGAESTVYVWGVESKRFGSALLLNFRGYSREAFHSHAFNAVSWVLRGVLRETIQEPGRRMRLAHHFAGLRPIYTTRSRFHKVDSTGSTWALSFRGPWSYTWLDQPIGQRRASVLTHGRREIGRVEP